MSEQTEEQKNLQNFEQQAIQEQQGEKEQQQEADKEVVQAEDKKRQRARDEEERRKRERKKAALSWSQLEKGIKSTARATALAEMTGNNTSASMRRLKPNLVNRHARNLDIVLTGIKQMNSVTNNAASMVESTLGEVESALKDGRLLQKPDEDIESGLGGKWIVDTHKKLQRLQSNSMSVIGDLQALLDAGSIDKQDVGTVERIIRETQDGLAKTRSLVTKLDAVLADDAKIVKQWAHNGDLVNDNKQSKEAKAQAQPQQSAQQDEPAPNEADDPLEIDPATQAALDILNINGQNQDVTTVDDDKPKRTAREQARIDTDKALEGHTHRKYAAEDTMDRNEPYVERPAPADVPPVPSDAKTMSAEQYSRYRAERAAQTAAVEPQQEPPVVNQATSASMPEYPEPDYDLGEPEIIHDDVPQEVPFFDSADYELSNDMFAMQMALLAEQERNMNDADLSYEQSAPNSSKPKSSGPSM